MIVYKTQMDEIPNTCFDCKCFWCNLPLKKNRSGYTDIIKQQYKTSRHEKCPLISMGDQLK